METQKAKKTVLFEEHQRLGGRMVEFAGWMMPVQYTSIIDEHLAVRNQVGIFDVSHMGEIDFQGPGALAAVQHLVCNDAAALVNGQVMYSGLLTERGTFVDDVLVHRISDTHFLFCVNASNTDKDYAWIMSHLIGDVVCRNPSDSVCQIAVQGPDAMKVVAPLVTSSLKDLRYYYFAWDKIAGHVVMLARTGYTGERGYEIYTDNESGVEIWQLLMASGAQYGIKPAGLGARDTLRFEASMPLYGNDIDDSTTPFDAGLDWIVKLNKDDFIGRDALLKQKQEGIQKKLVGLRLLEKGVPRHGYSIFHGSDKVGVVTSGTIAPYLKEPLAMGYVPLALMPIGTKLAIEIRGKGVPAEVVTMPFYNKKTKSSAK